MQFKFTGPGAPWVDKGESQLPDSLKIFQAKIIEFWNLENYCMQIEFEIPSIHLIGKSRLKFVYIVYHKWHNLYFQDFNNFG